MGPARAWYQSLAAVLWQELTGASLHYTNNTGVDMIDEWLAEAGSSLLPILPHLESPTLATQSWLPCRMATQAAAPTQQGSQASTNHITKPHAGAACALWHMIYTAGCGVAVFPPVQAVLQTLQQTVLQVAQHPRVLVGLPPPWPGHPQTQLSLPSHLPWAPGIPCPDPALRSHQLHLLHWVACPGSCWRCLQRTRVSVTASGTPTWWCT